MGKHIAKEIWQKIREAYEHGCNDEELNRVYGVNKSTIATRRQRENWLRPDAIARQELNGKRDLLPSGTQTAAQVLAERGERGSVIAAGLLLRLLERADKSPDKLRALSTVGDVATAITALRKSAGMDREQAQVSVSLAMFGDQGAAPWRDCTPSDSEASGTASSMDGAG